MIEYSEGNQSPRQAMELYSRMEHLISDYTAHFDGEKI